MSVDIISIKKRLAAVIENGNDLARDSLKIIIDLQQKLLAETARADAAEARVKELEKEIIKEQNFNADLMDRINSLNNKLSQANFLINKMRGKPYRN